MTQQRPDGTPWKITQEWLEWARARMDELGLDQTALAEVVGVSKMTISDIFRGASSHTRLMPQINRALGGTPPTQITTITVVDEMRQRIDEAWPDLTDSDRELIVQMAIALRRTGPSK
jgi:transcriptional regulator with XRE-family HTH domain